MQDLASFYRSFDDSSCQDDLALHNVLVKDREFSVELLVVLKFAGSCEEVEEAAEKVQIFAGHVGDQEDGQDVL